MEIYSEPAEVGEAEQHTFMSFEEFEIYKKSCEDLLNKAKAAERLATNPDFILIVMDDYFVKEPQRLGSLMATGRMNQSGFDGAANDLRSIGHLREFLQDYISKGNIATQELKDLEAAREEAIRAQAEESKTEIEA